MKIKEFKWININKLRVSEYNIRKSKLDNDLNELKSSIRKVGVLDPLTVVHNEKDQVYEIIKGQRRYLASKQLRDEGKAIFELPCIVIELDSPVEGIEISLLDELMKVSNEDENTGRAMVKLVEKHGSVDNVVISTGLYWRLVDSYYSRYSGKKENHPTQRQ